jgi:hypothetical protein
MQTSFSTIRTVTHNLRITAILKLLKLALCPLSAIATQSQGGEGYFLRNLIEIIRSVMEKNSEVAVIIYGEPRLTHDIDLVI